MEKYKVILYPRAYRDIDEIYSYIAIYKIDEQKKAVYVVTVQYHGRNF